MRSFILSAFLVLFVFKSNAQEINIDVISSAGESADQVDWTLGEIAVGETIFNSIVVLNEGFHQVNVDISKSIELEDNYEISVFPNPVNEFLFISSKDVNLGKARFELFSENGKKLNCPSLLHYTGKVELDLSQYPTGMYFLHIDINQQSHRFKILKH